MEKGPKKILYYKTQLSDIHLAQSLWHVMKQNICKEHEKMKCELAYPQMSTSVSQVWQFLKCL